MRFSLTRDQYVAINLPKGAVLVRDKDSDAVAYVYDTGPDNKRPAFCVFYGNQSKPVARYWCRDNAQREKSVREYFERRKQYLESVKARRSEPSPTRVKNAAIKAALEQRYGKGKVRVTNGSGTAHSWIKVKFLFPQPEGKRYGELQWEIVKLLEAKGLKLYTYGSEGGDYGSGVCMNVSWQDREQASEG